MARRRQAVTIRHVAADAGVSLQTVSRVINDQPNVRPAMKDKVQASIDKLGYVPSIAAQRMSGSRSYLILAINDRDRTIADWQARDGRDWIDQMLLGGMLTAAKRGYRMIFELVDTHADNVERELAAVIAALQPDGVIVTPPHSENPLITQILSEEGIPFARIGSKQEGPGFAMTMDDERLAGMAVDHLIELGHTRIGLIAGPDEYSLAKWRVDGWRQAMDNADLPHDDLMEQGDFSFLSGLKAARALLERDDPPTAIIASSDQMALATLDVARERGLHVPRDLSLVSFDNTPIVRYASPPLTAIDQPISKMTERAVQLLIDDRKNGKPEHPVVTDGELIVRGSTARARVRDTA